MSRLKLKRFRAEEPAPDVKARYLRVYHSKDLHFQPETLPPITSARLFGSERPLVFDLGCGRGDFIVGEAARHPALNYVGFDWHWKSIWKSIEQAHAAALDNVRFIRADFRKALVKVPDEAVTAIYLLFPPPATEYGKPKQETVTPETLAAFHRVLRPGAPFHFVTDSAPYFEKKLAVIRASGLFTIEQTARQFEGGVTWFQQFWESRDIQSKRVECRKVVQTSAQSPPG